MIRIQTGDALDVLRTMPAASCHSLVTDPPAAIGFMGRKWDGDRGGREQWVAWLAEILRECRRVLKPGAHALVWALPRTSHWTATAVEDAGFEVRDVVVHLYGQGYPKSTDLARVIDEHLGAERPVLGLHPNPCANVEGTVAHGGGYQDAPVVTAPASAEAKQWAGWGTALKPAAEHWILARVPLDATIAENVLEHGVGGINVDACRVECEGGSPAALEREAARRTGNARTYHGTSHVEAEAQGRMRNRSSPERYMAERPGEALGRWPANLVLDEDAAAQLDEQSGWSRSPGRTGRGAGGRNGRYGPIAAQGAVRCPADEGGASRFFYTPKPSRRERGEGNTHPTVKPLALMRWLVRLVTPPGGTVLDPFAGSGTTVLAALAESVFNCEAIEREGDYASIALRRARQIDPLFHDVPAPGAASGS